MDNNTQTEVEEYDEPIAVLKTRKIHAEKKLYGFRFQGWIMITVTLVGGVLGFAYTSHNLRSYQNIPNVQYISNIIFGAFGFAFIYGYFTFFLRMTVQGNLRRIEYKLARLGSEELKDNIEENFFTKLVQINFKYLDQYYLQTQEQAEKSFKIALFASVAGFVIIIIGILMMYTDKTQPAYVTTASGIITQFISAILFYLYNRTILKMSQYHQKLVLTQNISIALKITDDMDKDLKAKALETIIDRLTIDVNKYLTDNRE